ncbi:MFS transporter [Herbaspirillum sp. alder98]|uniref:MFS transporter n=1 Tax=Herbaspirillum sp. alder98 TaxID=2913096 RepID=UPI001CD8B7F3|nr:MFS transporter [Herbaspirillum sp. alder98]MCA1325077.1 MFS transporter [Herbaspirillum sp. alder98]
MARLIEPDPAMGRAPHKKHATERDSEMTYSLETSHKDSSPASPQSHHGMRPLIRWFIASATLNLPQAAGPVAFSLLALSLTGQTSGGAAMILAMTIAQVIGVIPITRFGARFSAVKFLRALVALRSMALAAMALGAWTRVSFETLVVLAALAGMVNGAAHGYVRAVLNHLVTSSRLPRALGIAATLNEMTYVLAPVLASVLGGISPVFALCVIAALGTLPALLIPDASARPLAHSTSKDGRIFTPSIALWLLCAMAGGATVASIEIGAVALALTFDHAPAHAVLFTIPLCVASVAGGIWVSISNKPSSRMLVLAQLALMTTGSLLAALEISLLVTVLGTILIGCVIAPLSTHYSLSLDALAPAHRKAEVFALQRTANAAGIILASALLTFTPVSSALTTITTIVALTTLWMAVGVIRKRRRIA